MNNNQIFTAANCGQCCSSSCDALKKLNYFNIPSTYYQSIQKPDYSAYQLSLPYTAYAFPIIVPHTKLLTVLNNQPKSQLNQFNKAYKSVVTTTDSISSSKFHDKCVERYNSIYSAYLPKKDIYPTNLVLANSIKQGGTNLKVPLVLPIISGDFRNEDNKHTMHTSVVLIIDKHLSTKKRKFILVDTGLSNFKQLILNGLYSYGVEPSMIDTIIITHPGTDTMGNLNLFPCAQVFSANRISKENIFVDQKPPTFESLQSDLPYHRLYSNTKIYLTPGFGLQDQSLVVYNVENHGVVSIVGKLILNQNDLNNSNMTIREFANDDVDQRKLWQATRQEIICLSDYIIPGHGLPFKVSDELKLQVGCQNKPKKLIKY